MPFETSVALPRARGLMAGLARASEARSGQVAEELSHRIIPGICRQYFLPAYASPPSITYVDSTAHQSVWRHCDMTITLSRATRSVGTALSVPSRRGA